jgi:hypothetical protein
VQVGAIKNFSDVYGRHMVHLSNSYEYRNDFANRLGRLCKVDTTGTQWTKAGNFVPTAPDVAAAGKKRRKLRGDRVVAAREPVPTGSARLTVPAVRDGLPWPRDCRRRSPPYPYSNGVGGPGDGRGPVAQLVRAGGS